MEFLIFLFCSLGAGVGVVAILAGKTLIQMALHENHDAGSKFKFGALFAIMGTFLLLLTVPNAISAL